MAPDILRLFSPSYWSPPRQTYRFGDNDPWFEKKRKERKKARAKKKMNGRNGNH